MLALDHILAQHIVVHPLVQMTSLLSNNLHDLQAQIDITSGYAKEVIFDLHPGTTKIVKLGKVEKHLPKIDLQLNGCELELSDSLNI